MEKDILTIQNIQSDLRHQLRGMVILTVVCAIFFALTFWLFLAVLDEPGGFFTKLRVALLPILLLIMVVAGSKSIYETCSVLKKPGSIVTDRVVGIETKDHMYKGVFLPRCDQTYHLRFAGYGEYVIPYHNFSWSGLHAMDADMVYFHAECGDEFYLVLSKPHTGKILLAYPTKMFILQETEKEEKMV